MKKVLKVLGGLVALLVVAIGGLYFKANSTLTERVDVALPPIKAATDPQSLARGEHIFRSVCVDCHASNDRASGSIMPDVPAPLAVAYTANLTAHPTAGIKSVSDEQIARAVRFGINRDGQRLMIMSRYAMSDEDLASVIGFMRSGDPLFTPDEKVQPRPQLSFVGRLAMGMGMSYIPTWPVSGIKAPPKGPTAEYGAYLSSAVYACADCHTPGHDATKSQGPDAYKGGFKFLDTPEGGIYSTNLTFHETGLGSYTLPEFSRVLREGIARDGHALRFPMIRLRGLDDVDAQALYTFFQSLPKAESRLPKDAAPRVKVAQQAPEQLFSQLGCALCHGEGAKHRAMLKQARGKEASEVARWIRNPETIRPGTQMPTYEEVLDETQAMSLATWVQAQAANIP